MQVQLEPHKRKVYSSHKIITVEEIPLTTTTRMLKSTLLLYFTKSLVA